MTHPPLLHPYHGKAWNNQMTKMMDRNLGKRWPTRSIIEGIARCTHQWQWARSTRPQGKEGVVSTMYPNTGLLHRLKAHNIIVENGGIKVEMSDNNGSNTPCPTNSRDKGWAQPLPWLILSHNHRGTIILNLPLPWKHPWPKSYPHFMCTSMASPSPSLPKLEKWGNSPS